jgi:hypothetical protein
MTRPARLACRCAEGPCDGNVRDWQVHGVDEARETRVPGSDTDEPPWSEWCDEDGGYVWREDVIEELLASENGPTL